MSYQYRSEKRKCAHWLLGILSTEFVKSNAYENVNEIWAKSYSIITIREIREKHSQYSMQELYFAAMLLAENKHVTLQINKRLSYDVEIFCELEGEDAYLSGFYLKENEKDQLETIELKTKWVIPVISLVLSLAAFWFSIYIFFHPHK